MRFDHIIGNPPYQDSSHCEKKNTLWRKFVDLSLRMCNDKGIIAFIVPSSWMGSKELLKKYFLNHNLLFINKDECKRHFNVGSTFSYYIMEKGEYCGITKIVNKEINGDIVSSEIDIRDYIFDSFPRNLSIISNSILKKVLDKKLPVLGIINSTTHHNVHHDRWKTQEQGDFVYPVYNTPSKLYFFNTPHRHQNIPKIIIPTTTYYRKTLFTTFGTTQSFCYLLLDDKIIPEIALSNLNNILFDYVNECFRYANWNNVQVLKKLPLIPLDRKMSDMDILNFFGIDTEEAEYIKKQIRWR